MVRVAFAVREAAARPEVDEAAVFDTPEEIRRRALTRTAIAAGAGILVGILIMSLFLPGSPIKLGQGRGHESGRDDGQTTTVEARTATTPPTVPDGTPAQVPKTGLPKTGAPKTGPITLAPGQATASAGHLSLNDGDCGHVLARSVHHTCGVTITAVGGPVRWAVTSVTSSTAKVTAAGSGSLVDGASAIVTVNVQVTPECTSAGFGNARIGFSPSGTAGVSYSCW